MDRYVRSKRRSKKRSKIKLSKTKGRIKNHLALELYIKKVLSQIHPDSQISGDTLSQLNALLNHLILTLTESADHFRILKDQKTLTARDVMIANKIILPGELARHGVSELTKAVTKYTSNIDKKNKSKKRTKASVSGLVFPPTLIGNFMKKNMKGKNTRLSATASVAMASIVEYITAEILELSGNCARDSRQTRITPRCLLLAIKNDSELDSLLYSIRFKIIRGGVIPHIHSELIIKKSKKKKSKRSRKRRSRQNFGRFMSFGVRRNKNTKIPNAAILRLIRRAGGTRVSKMVYEDSRAIMTKLVENIMHNAINHAINSRRNTINADDIWNSLHSKMYSNVVKFGKYKPGTKAVMEIRKLQKGTGLLIPKATFKNFVRYIAMEFKTDLRFTAGALNILQYSVESYMIDLYRKALNNMILSGRTTLSSKDIETALDNKHM